MSNETPAAPAAAPTPAAAPAASAAPAAAPVTPPAAAATPPAATPPETPPASGEQPKPWQVPEAHKDKPWASKVKSEEDLYKQIDNLTALAGKKTLTIDYATATPEEIAAHHKALAPADVKDYSFDKVEGVDPVRMGEIAPILQKAGLTVHQAQNVAKEYAAYENSMMANATSEAGFREQMTTSFGEKYEPMVAQVVEVHKAHLSPEDQKLMDAMPNEYLGGVYRLTQKMAEAHKNEVAALKKQYGVEENGDAHLNKGGNIPPVDINVTRSKLRQEIADINARPHTAEEKQKKIDELQATYNQQPARK